MTDAKHDTDCVMTLVEDALRAARNAGAEWCDISCGRYRTVSVDVENASIKSVDVIADSGFTVRAIVSGATGICSATGFEAQDLVAGAADAVAMAKAAQPDPDFRALPEPSADDEVDGLYDERIAAITPEEAVNISVKNVEAAREVDPEVTIAGGTNVNAGEGVFASSTGIRLHHKSTSAEVSFFSIVRKGGDSGSFYEFTSGRVWDDVDPLMPGPEATRHALRFLGAQKVDTRRMSLVLGPLASFSFLRSLASHMNAESIQRKRSFMVDKLGKPIASPILTLRDDGLIARGLFSGRHDGEGAPRQTVTLVEDGVFKAMLHNSYTAGKASAANTGHGGRTGGIRPTNLVATLGDRTAEEIIAETEEGVYINMGSVHPDGASGDISASVDFGYKIENGKLAYPVVNTMVSGDIFTFLKNLDAISSDYRQEPGNKLPTIRIRDVQVSGSR